jgi:hypothetical protein
LLNAHQHAVAFNVMWFKVHRLAHHPGRR